MTSAQDVGHEDVRRVGSGSNPATDGVAAATGVPSLADVTGGEMLIADATSTDVCFCIRAPLARQDRA